MPTYSIRALDKAGRAGLRALTRPVHLDHLAVHSGQIIAAGALLDDDGAGPVGSLLIVDMPSRPDVERFMEADPYFGAGLFESIEIRQIRLVYPSQTVRAQPGAANEPVVPGTPSA